ncbi:hypothetical protein PV327_009870 [Microctonus hyperodae]|uniref:Uncharacterized protein n=1 Tax=Microctonus hyperodae TaxID=165561 RepID=A0AA39KG09_MICHY|nr:hypothetical protein PV327_009870 [Microctonus hyperodae]
MHPEFAREIDLLPYCNIQDNKMWKEISLMTLPNVYRSSKITSKIEDNISKALRTTVVANIFREENTEDTIDDEAIWEFLSSDQTNCY